MTYTFQIGRTVHGPKDTQLALRLRAMQAPSKKRTTVPLAEAYYPTAELKALLGEGLPYVDAKLSEAMLDACRVTYRLDAKALVKRLKQHKAESSGTTKQLQGIYRALDERLWESDAVYIKRSFSEDGLIQMKGAHKGWFKPSELTWRSNSLFLDSQYPPLHSLYRDFSKFFVDKLGISKELSTSKWVGALTRLDELTSLEERIAEAMTIYRRANRDLGPRFGREVETPDWIATFQSEAVYINQRGELVANDEYLFANDFPAVAALFEGREHLSFIAIPNVEVPRLSRLLDAAKVARLSNSIAIAVSNADSGVVDADLTERVRRSIYFFARVLYTKRPDAFEQALHKGRFADMRRFDVAKVPQVEMVVSLGEHSAETTSDMALFENRVLYRAGAKSVIDMLAAELSKFLCASTDLADTFARILMESEVDSVEDFLTVRSFGAIPLDLLEVLDNSPSLTVGQDEGNDTDGVTVEQSDGVREVIPEEEPRTAEGRTEPAEAGDPPLIQASPIPAFQAKPSPESPQAPVYPSNGDGFTPSGPPTYPINHQPSGVQSLVGAGGNSNAFSSGKVDSQSSDLPAQPVLRNSILGSSGSGGKYQKQRQGQRQPNRTKRGRLLSYAAGPETADKPNPDSDPARAAAREAVARAAVEYFMTTQAGRWKSLTEMSHNNPGFDIQAIANDGHDEFIEVKGQSGAWTEEGVALTPTELMTAQQKGDRYWLCVVEYAQDDKRRQLHLLRNPYGLTQQFRFDVGWKSVAESTSTVQLKPEKDLYIDMLGVGRGRIVSVRGKGQFFNLHVILDGGRQVNKLFNPAKMTLSKEPTWQE